MSSIVGRRCVRFKNVQTGSGVSRRCAKYGEDPTEDNVEHSAFGSFGKYVPTALKGSTDTLIGAGIGLAGVAATKFALANLPAVAGMLPGVVQKAVPAIGGALGAVASYAVTRNKSYALGAFGAGVALNAWELLKGQFPALSDLVTYNIPGYGLLQPEAMQRGAPGQYGGYAALIDDPRPGMSELAMMSMDEEAEAAP